MDLAKDPSSLLSASLVASSLLAACLFFTVGCGSNDAPSPAETAVRDNPAPTTESTEPTQTAPPPVADRDAEIAASQQLLERGDLPAAEAKLKEWLVRDPNDAEVIFRLAMIVASRDDLSQAVELLDSIPADHPDAGLPALGQSADWCFQLERYREAEQRYLKILDVVPNAPQAHRQLAYLYNRQGRRHEAAAHIYSLCRQANVRQDELHALIHLSDAMYTPLGESVQGDERPYWPIGPEAEGRRLFAAHQYQDAVEVLRPTVMAMEQPASVIALFGRAAAEAQDEQALQWWLAQPDQSMRDFADYWAALGLFLVSESRLEESGRALLEAIVRDPTDFRSISRLRSVLESLGFSEEAVRMEERFQTLEAISRINNQIADSTTPNVAAMVALAERLDSVDRRLEGSLWRLVAAFNQQLPPDAIAPIQAQFGEAVKLSGTESVMQSRICNIDREQFSLPDIESLHDATEQHIASLGRQDAATIQPGFENIADAIGLRHAYQVASEPQDRGFSVYQSVGGAVAVLDYDRDGRIDLYFAQGDADPSSFVGETSNQLFRAQDSGVIDVTDSAAATEYRYSLGVTAGDWNQDGFEDIVIANIGANTLLLNNGDGTFRREVIDDRDDKTLMTTSVAMGDLTGDHLPDVYEVNYLHDPGFTKRPRRNADGEVIETIMPKDFKPGLDRLIVQQADGKTSIQPMGDSDVAARAGLGVVVGDFDHQPGNEIFVGNDVYANQLWQRGEDGTWVDVAMLVGSAYGFSGTKTASMGIAAADFDRNGWLDFHITNFQGESVSHYLNSGGMYQDRNIQFRLSDATKSVLGFGAQALDYDNDGDLDLVVANGHIENAVNSGASFEQPAQLFCNLGDRFESIEVVDRSGYWGRNHVGRGLARLDWNRDGLNDFVVTHLGETSALLINRTNAPNHHWLQLVLVGVQSERDAIGARVQLRAGDRELTEWVVSGDGFFSRNEPVVSFGLGEIDQVDEVKIVWPSGSTQTFDGLPIDQRLLIVEGESQPFRL